MCGIVGAIAQRDVSPILLEGLKRLEYRGYDSAGIAVINPQQQLDRRRSVGKVNELVKRLDAEPLFGNIGIAHTRWATHGKPSEENAHPLCSNSHIAVVHNGIIENHMVLRQRLIQDGYQFASDTDTEIIPHLLNQLLAQGNDLIKAVQKTVKQLEGAYALAILDANHPDCLIIVRSGSPLVIGLGIGENFISSDKLALLPVSQRFIYLENGDMACVTRQHIDIYDKNDQKINRDVHKTALDHDFVERGKYRHYMLKEIFDQPEAVSNALEGRLCQNGIADNIFDKNNIDIFVALKNIQTIQIAACGTSYHAGLVARYWLEAIAGITTQVETASELQYRQKVIPNNTLLISISQSGETADTLNMQRTAKSLGYFATLAICNVAESSLVREADFSLMTHAGIEIGVASTKAFTSQLTCLFLLTLFLGRCRQHMTEKTITQFVRQLEKLPKQIAEILTANDSIQALAQSFEHKQHALFIGRGTQYPIALEGALKLKEISYIHAEGYSAGELKHGPLALLDTEMPVIVLAPNDALIDKIKSNIQEIHARGAQLFIFSDDMSQLAHTEHITVLPMPVCDKILTPILYTIPLQLLAYHVAVLKGTDVDQPRNLAKSVTVE